MYLVDFKYLLINQLLSRFVILELQYFDAISFCPRLTTMTKQIFDMKRTGTALQRNLLKPLILRGLGRYALDLSHTETSKASLYLKSEEIDLALQLNKLHSLVKGNNTFYGIEKPTKLSNYNISQKSIRAGTCSPIFGLQVSTYFYNIL